MIKLRDAHQCSEETLRRLLSFCLERDPSGPRMRQDPPKNKQAVIVQLTWLGVIQ